jgi:hypothetical protein
MRKRIILSIIVILACWPGEVSAQNTRSSDLMAHCALSTGPDDYCMGLMNGYSDAAQLFQITECSNNHGHFPPGNVPPFCLLSGDTDVACTMTSKVSHLFKNVPSKLGTRASQAMGIDSC